MAGKSRRVASRQGELSRRKKRTQRGPSGIPATTPNSAQPQQNGGGVAALTAEPAASVAPVAGAQQAAPAPNATERPSPRGAGQPRGQARVRGERPTAYNYVGSELRRIGLLATVVVAALIAVSFVL